MDEIDADDDLEEAVGRADVALEPNEAADPRNLIDGKIPADIFDRYEVHSYRGAAVILSEAHRLSSRIYVRPSAASRSPPR